MQFSTDDFYFHKPGETMIFQWLLIQIYFPHVPLRGGVAKGLADIHSKKVQISYKPSSNGSTTDRTFLIWDIRLEFDTYF